MSEVTLPSAMKRVPFWEPGHATLKQLHVQERESRNSQSLFRADNVFTLPGLKANHLHVKLLVELVWWLNWIARTKVYLSFHMKRVPSWDPCTSCRLHNRHPSPFELPPVPVIVPNPILTETSIGAGSLGNTMDMITSMIRNASKCILILSAGSGHYFVPVAKVEKGGEYAMRLGMNWAYREFQLEYEDDAGKKVLVTSDDCCDYERITITERDGQLVLDTVPRNHYGPSSSEAGWQTKTIKRSFLSWLTS
uniref:DUF7748 domain-containing protein n=1 Tax=Physcomitrium patens TaxID=3218 RepID=A0A2K1IN72_PHYPA|nr:hypothetical protein PHYPA_027039 [Physcomitrium patens]